MPTGLNEESSVMGSWALQRAHAASAPPKEEIAVHKRRTQPQCQPPTGAQWHVLAPQSQHTQARAHATRRCEHAAHERDTAQRATESARHARSRMGPSVTAQRLCRSAQACAHAAPPQIARAGARGTRRDTDTQHYTHGGIRLRASTNIRPATTAQRLRLSRARHATPHTRGGHYATFRACSATCCSLHSSAAGPTHPPRRRRTRTRSLRRPRKRLRRLRCELRRPPPRGGRCASLPPAGSRRACS